MSPVATDRSGAHRAAALARWAHTDPAERTAATAAARAASMSRRATAMALLEALEAGGLRVEVEA